MQRRGLLAVLLTVPVLVLPGRAEAAPAPTTRLLFTVGTSPAAERAATWNGSALGPAAPAYADGATPMMPAMAADGSRLVDTESDEPEVSQAPDDTGPFQDVQVDVRDASGQLVRRILCVQHVDACDSPALSPDGDQLLFHRDVSGGPSSSWVTTGADDGPLTPLAGATGATFLTYLDATTVIGWRNGALFTLPAAGGTASDVTGLPEAAVPNVPFTVVPGGQALLYESAHDDGNQVRTAPLTGPDDARAVGASRVVSATSVGYGPPIATPDGQTVFFAALGTSSRLDLFAVPFAGGTTAQLTATPTDEYFPLPLVVDHVAPGAVTALPISLGGSSAQLHWYLPADDDVSGVLITRKLGSTAQRSRVYVPRSSSDWTDTGLALNKTYSYVLQAVDRSGNVGPAVTRSMTAVTPTITFADPTSRTSTSAPFDITWGAGQPANVRYFGAWRYYARPPATEYSENMLLNNSAPGHGRFYGIVSASYASSQMGPGDNMQFLVTVRDAYGNSSPVRASGLAVVPYDQTLAQFTGSTSTSLKNSHRWLGTVRILKAAGAAARLTVSGSRFDVIGERCTTCGVMDVYDDGTRIASVDTRAGSTTYRQVLFSRALVPGTHHLFVLKSRGTTGRPLVLIDGFGVRA